MVFSEYDRVFVFPEQIVSAYNRCLHSILTPTVLPKDDLAESSSEEQMKEEDESDFWRQPPLTKTRAFMCSIWKGMKKIFRGHIPLRRQMEEQNEQLECIEEGL